MGEEKCPSDGSTDQELGVNMVRQVPAIETETEGSLQEDEVADVKPEGGYGWLCVVALLAINAFTWGVNTSFGVYISYYLENNYFDASRMQYAWVGGLAVAMCDISGPLANWMTKKFGFKVPMLIGGVLVSIGQCLAGITHSFVVFIVCQGVVFGLGLGLILLPSYPLLAHWFDKKLALAQGVANAGSGLGGLVLSNTTSLLLQRLGVKWTLIINGCISAAVIIPSILVLRGRHAAVKAKSAPLQISFVYHPGFKWVLAWAVASMMQYFIAVYTIASFASDGLGLDQDLAGAVQSILAGGQVIGRPFWGYLLDRGGRINMVLVSYILCGIFTYALWLPSRSFGTVAAYALLQGICGGTVVSASTPVAASVVGVTDLSSALGIFWLVLAVPSLCAQPLAIALVDYSISSLGRHGASAYSISIALTGAICFVGVLTLYMVKRYLQGSWALVQKV